MQVFTDEVLSHLNRILAGKMVTPRNLGELRRALEGRTMTKEEAQRLFAQWISGGGETDEDVWAPVPLNLAPASTQHFS